MYYNIKIEKEFKYIEKGNLNNDVLLLLHGLFGELSNWNSILNSFYLNYRIIIPVLPIYDFPLKKTNLNTFINFLDSFIKFKKLKSLTLIGNSLGGHLSLIYALKKPLLVKRIILLGSSGLFENFSGTSFPRRSDYYYIKSKINCTFFNFNISNKVNLNDIFNLTKNMEKAMRIICIARSAQKNNISKYLKYIKIPTLLIWGFNDTITPYFVAYNFNRLILYSILKFINFCCHAPMMEYPIKFNRILKEFLINNSLKNIYE